MGVTDVLRLRHFNKKLYEQMIICPKCKATLSLDDTQEDAGKEIEEYTECPACDAQLLITRLVVIRYSLQGV